MTQVIKFPDLRPPPRRTPIPELPTPSQYRQLVPTFLPVEDAKTVRIERQRLYKWFGVAVALHAALLLGLWLTPPLRLKWAPSSDAWVQVTSLPSAAAPVVPVPVPLLVPLPDEPMTPAGLSRRGPH